MVVRKATGMSSGPTSPASTRLSTCCSATEHVLAYSCSRDSRQGLQL